MKKKINDLMFVILESGSILGLHLGQFSDKMSFCAKVATNQMVVLTGVYIFP